MAAISILSAATQTASATEAGWHHTFEEAASAARASGKPLIVHFYADWCGPCRQMESQTLNQPAVTSLLSRSAVGVKINADHHPDLVERFSINSLPTDILISSAGQIIARNSGFLSAQQYVASIASAAQHQSNRPRKTLPQQPDTTLAERKPEASPNQPKNVASNDRNTRPKHPATRPESPQSNSPNSASAPIMIVSQQPPMLRGYSPVALQTRREWKLGLPEYAVEYRGQIYRLASAGEKSQFLADPRQYTPRLMGCDAVVFSQFDRAIPGKLEYTAFYGDEVYLFHSDENRVRFRATPEKFISTRVVNLSDIEAVIR